MFTSTRSYAARARLAFGLAVALLAIGAPLASVARAATQSFEFSGHVQASGGTQWVIHKLENANAGALTATLNWGTASANLNMFLLDANGNTKATAATSNRPETITHALPTNGLWKIRVSAKAGSTDYTLRVDIATDALDPPDEPPTAGSQSFDFSGHVYAGSKPQWIVHKLENANAGALTATLNWGTASANLNMFLLDANGKTKKSAAGSARPERITFTLPNNGLWKIRVSAKSGNSAYTLRVDIVSGNSAPNAVDDAAPVDQNVAKAVSPLANDSDPNGDALAIGAVGSAGNGTVTKSIDNQTITYTPNPDFVGTDSFTYEACDNAAEPLCDTATVNVTVTAPRTTNAAPVANNDSAVIDTNSNIVVNVLANDTDADGDLLTPVIDTNGVLGTATVNPNGTITYAAAGVAGADSFTYHVCDNWTTAACSNTATANVTVSEVQSGSGLLLHAPEFMTTKHTLTREQALQDARDFHVISTGDVSLYKHYVADMRTAAADAGHPLLMLQYVNGTHSFPNEASAITDENMFMHTAGGERVKSKDFGNYLMNIVHPAWIQNRINACNTKIAQGGNVDGCFLDTLGLAPLNPTYVTPGPPHNPATGATWTATDWLNATSNIARQIKANLGGKKVWVNGLLNGTYYSATTPTKQLLDASDGGMIEIFLRPPNTAVTAYPNETKWKADIDMLAAAAGRGDKPLVTTTKVWVPGTQQQYEAWHRYALASFYMGTTGHEYFNFRLDKNKTTRDKFADVPIGTPTAAYGKVGAYYKRNFTNGIVVVNPTKNPVTVTLDRQYRNLQGQLVSGNLTMAANTGDVLVKA
jgi:hypothetical protein